MKIRLILLLSMVATATQALEITITRGNETALPIAIAPFPGSAIVANDFRLSGEFAPLPEEQMISKPTHIDNVNFTDWRMLEVPTLLTGRVINIGGKPKLEIQLINVYQQKLLMKPYRFSLGDGGDKKIRQTAHAVSDLVYKKLTGVRGVFSTHIAYISVKNRGDGDRIYTLELADADGENAQVMLTSSAPLLSPSWSPDGRKLAYVSFENRRSEVWIQGVYTGERTKIASFEGKNSAPAWSPDGGKLALSLSRDGNSEIYTLDIGSSTLKRITKNRAVDTEPVWSASGDRIVFLSDRSGRPQIYQIGKEGGRAQRLTYKGHYNTSPDLSADGRYLVMLGGDSGNYRIAVQDLNSGVVRILSDNRQDESPSFAPNDRLIVYATQNDGEGVLEVTSVDGGGVQQLSLEGKDVREPSWSPFLR